MTFKRIVVVDQVNFSPAHSEALSAMADEVEIFETDPSSETEVIARVGNADAVIVSWRTKIVPEVFEACPTIKAIALAASAYADPAKCNVDLTAAVERNVSVSTLGQYGDEATAEWVLGVMLGLTTKLLPLPWRKSHTELFGKTLGIVGMGHMGHHVAKRARAFDMNVLYSSRTEKSGSEYAGLTFVPLHEMLAQSDIVSIHIAKGAQALDAAGFAALKDDVLLINTSLGPVFDPQAFTYWINARKGFVISDQGADPSMRELMEDQPNAWVSDQLAADSDEMRLRRSDQIVENLQAFLNGSPVRLQAASA